MRHRLLAVDRATACGDDRPLIGYRAVDLVFNCYKALDSAILDYFVQKLSLTLLYSFLESRGSLLFLRSSLGFCTLGAAFFHFQISGGKVSKGTYHLWNKSLTTN